MFLFLANYIYDNNDGCYLAWLDTEDKFDRNMACSGNQTTRLWIWANLLPIGQWQDYHLLEEQTLDTKLTFYWRYEHIININILIHLKNYDFGIWYLPDFITHERFYFYDLMKCWDKNKSFIYIYYIYFMRWRSQ